MKILQVTESFAPMWEYGGVARVAHDISHELKTKGHQVKVVTINRNMSYGYSDNKLFSLNDIDTYYLGMVKNSILNKLLVIPLPSTIKIIKTSTINSDIIHIHDYRSLLTLAVVYFSKKNNIPYIIQAHGAIPKISKGGLKTIFDLLVGKKILQGAKALIALTETEFNYYLDMGVEKERVHTLPNGVATDFFPLPKRNIFKDKLNLSDRNKLITFVGRIDDEKGVDMLILAFSSLYKSDSNLRLILVGPASGVDYQNKLDEIIQTENISEAVIQTGFVTTEEKKEILVDSDVFVTPSYNGFPISFLEACACGVPIVTTTNGDTLEWIDNSVGVVSEFSTSGLAVAIKNILNDKELSKKFIQKEEELMIQRFNWERIVDKLLEIYKQ